MQLFFYRKKYIMAEPSTSTNDELKQKERLDEPGINRKRKHSNEESQDDETCETPEQKIPKNEFSSYVAQHYNKLPNAGLAARRESKIYYLRNFNNWVKSILINVYSGKLNRVDNVLDLCCGKGGDLLKWIQANIRHLICADIAGLSVEQCQSRYNDCRRRTPNIFSCEFITADCTRVRLRERFENPDIKLDLVSCQFSFHYCFESLPQAERMLKNASECLRIGGYFIGTMPDANEIVKRIRKSDGKIFKNRIFSIEMGSDEPYPLFGAQYDFSLDSVVQCPEFLVHFPTLIKLANKYGLSLDGRSSFADFYNEHIHDNKKQFLLKKMFGLEPYSLNGNTSQSSEEYGHCEKYCKTNGYFGVLGTISKSEWDAICLYQVFAFQKVRECGNDVIEN